MLVKWAPLTSMGAVCPIFDIDEEAYTKDGGRAVSQLLEVPRGETRLFGTDVIPAGMRKAGVHKLRWATLMLSSVWRGHVRHTTRSGDLGLRPLEILSALRPLSNRLRCALWRGRWRGRRRSASV